MRPQGKNVKSYLRAMVTNKCQGPNSGGPPTTSACQELFSSKILRKVAITPRKSPKDLTNFFMALEEKRLDTTVKAWYNRRRQIVFALRFCTLALTRLRTQSCTFDQKNT